jgi:hypothetical protein
MPKKENGFIIPVLMISRINKFWKGFKQPFLILAIGTFQFTIALLCDMQIFVSTGFDILVIISLQ